MWGIRGGVPLLQLSSLLLNVTFCSNLKALCPFVTPIWASDGSIVAPHETVRWSLCTNSSNSACLLLDRYNLPHLCNIQTALGVFSEIYLWMSNCIWSTITKWWVGEQNFQKPPFLLSCPLRNRVYREHSYSFAYKVYCNPRGTKVAILKDVILSLDVASSNLCFSFIVCLITAAVTSADASIRFY